MKNLSIRLKITLWFSAALILVAVITFGSVLFVGNQIIQKTIRDNLIETIEYNADEIHFYTSLENVDLQGDLDYFFLYKDGYLQINHDFLSSVNEVYTSLCSANDTLIYGENPLILETADLPFLDRQIQTVRINKTIYYIFDRKLSVDGTDVLWLRGVVSENQGDVQIVSIARTALILLPCITLLAIIGGYVIACRALNPIQHIIDSAGNISQGEDLKKRIEIGQGHDELHQLADCLNEMYERLDNAFQAEKRFTSDASHELRTPITVIMSQCELSLENASTTQEYREALYVIRRQAQKMTRLIRDMLDITRLELRVTQYPLLNYDISEQVQSLCDDMALIRENNIDLNCDIQKNVLYHGNPDLMTRLLTNLITNAYRYGNPNGHIRVTLQTCQNFIELTVSDDGIGISSEEQQKIFRRFYQVDRAKNNHGSGLGLSMVSEIVKFHHGQITVESQLSKGSTFTCIFPK